MDTPDLPIRLHLVEDHDLTRFGLRALLSAQPDFQVVAEARTGEEALDQLTRFTADVILMDINMPGMDGIQAAQEARLVQPSAQIVMLTASNRRDQLFAALASGAIAYCLKSAPPAVMFQAIRSAASGSAFFDPESARHLLHTVQGSAPLAPLTERDMAILRLVADGQANKDIATTLGISVGLVKKHIGEILEKLQATDRTQAAIKAFRAGLI
ncbi:response regulator [Deinococcus soli (ex Cha et al. 2016)]|uniref:response regulator n=1 Tax=Deinococcus soli (ex Cha et al. 2016) TaxID=1309411 RepID=UPI0016648782|nr:response regulator transcription factor [Deinococcus soli (ex Cha et al. 2016)]GGB81842.1 DNA-binding response regulator [Deinococcus soli (ex Cha et al. 2016)]